MDANDENRASFSNLNGKAFSPSKQCISTISRDGLKPSSNYNLSPVSPSCTNHGSGNTINIQLKSLTPTNKGSSARAPPSNSDVAAAIAAIRSRGMPQANQANSFSSMRHPVHENNATMKKSNQVTKPESMSITKEEYAVLMEQKAKVNALLRHKVLQTLPVTPATLHQGPDPAPLSKPKEGTDTLPASSSATSPGKTGHIILPEQSVSTPKSSQPPFFKFAFASRAIPSYQFLSHYNPVLEPIIEEVTQQELLVDDSDEQTEFIVRRLYLPSSTIFKDTHSRNQQPTRAFSFPSIVRMSCLGWVNENELKESADPSMEEGLDVDQINRKMTDSVTAMSDTKTIDTEKVNLKMCVQLSEYTDSMKARSDEKPECVGRTDEIRASKAFDDEDRIDPIYLEDITNVGIRKENVSEIILRKQTSLTSETVDSLDSALSDESISSETKKNIGAYIDALLLAKGNQRPSDYFTVDDLQDVSSDEESSYVSVSVSSELEQQLHYGVQIPEASTMDTFDIQCINETGDTLDNNIDYQDRACYSINDNLDNLENQADKGTIAEYRDKNNGDVEIYLFEDTNIEVAYVV